MKILALSKANLIRQTRSSKFIWMVAAIAVLGIFCIPPVDANYSVVGIGGTRGIYNSAWLGAIAAIISSVAIWIPGFYWLRGEISEDRRLKIGEMLASSPISKTRYIFGKMIANLAVLWLLQILFVASFIILQILRGESRELNLLDYLIPLLVISLPNLLLLSALTILFDVVPFLKGVLGNIIFIGVWNLIIFSGAETGVLDFFNSEFIMSDMLKVSALTYPEVYENGTNFGFNPTEKTLPTFRWTGIPWHDFSVVPMLFCLIAGILLIIISILLFDRFKRLDHKTRWGKTKYRLPRQKDPDSQTAADFSGVLSPVKINSHSILVLAVNEIKVLILRIPLLQVMLIIGGAVVIPFLKGNFTILIMLFPVMILSRLGCQNRIYRTVEMLYANCAPGRYLFANYLAGLAITGIISLVHLAVLLVNGRIGTMISWIIGLIFTCTLALFCGDFTGNKKMFEAVYILLFYLWLNNVRFFDFMGTAGNENDRWYILLTIILLAVVMMRHRSQRRVY